MEHTKGKWTLRGRDIWADDHIIATVRDKNLIGKTGGVEEFLHQPFEANARLMSAAPEMLEALKEVWAILDGMRKPGINLYVAKETVEKAENAIAKAEGK